MGVKARRRVRQHRVAGRAGVWRAEGRPGAIGVLSFVHPGEGPVGPLHLPQDGQRHLGQAGDGVGGGKHGVVTIEMPIGLLETEQSGVRVEWMCQLSVAGV